MPYADPQKQLEYQRKWMENRRQQAIALLGGECVSCGSKDDLQIDHVDPETKDDFLKKYHTGAMWSRTWEWIKAELAKCQILCRPCHLAKTIAQDESAYRHGTPTSYMKRRCRCDECRAWQSARLKRQRSRPG